MTFHVRRCVNGALLVALLFFGHFRVVYAQEPSTSSTISGFTGGFTDDCSAFEPLLDSSKKLDLEQLREAIRNLLGQPGRRKNRYWMLHVAKWSEETIEKQRWVVLADYGRWIQQNIQEGRIYGSQDVYLLFVHFGVRNQTDGLKAPITYRVTVVRKRPENVQDFIDLAKFLAKGIPKGIKNLACGWGGGKLNIPYRTSEITVQALGANPPAPAEAPEVAISASLTSDEQHLVISAKGTANLEEVQFCKNGVCFQRERFDPNKPGFPASRCLHAVCNIQGFFKRFGEERTTPPIRIGPIDAPAPASSGPAAQQKPEEQEPEPKEISKASFLDEDIHWWDVSLGFQVREVKELELNAEDLIVQPKQIDRQNVWAFFNFFPFSRLERNLRIKQEHVSLPSLLFGMPISGKPLNRIFVGGAVGIKKVQFFAGASFESVKRPQTLAIGDAATPAQLAADLTSGRKAKFMMGVNLPVRKVIELLSKK